MKCLGFGCSSHATVGRYCAVCATGAETTLDVLRDLDAREPFGGVVARVPLHPQQEEQKVTQGEKVGRRAEWTRETVIDAIKEVAAKVGRAPSGKDMQEHGRGGAYQASVFKRLGSTWPELVREAGFEPLGKTWGAQQRATTARSSGPARNVPPDPPPFLPLPPDPEAGRTGFVVPAGPYGETIQQLEIEAVALELRAVSLRRIADELRTLGDAA